MGQVYRARDARLNRSVAIKLLASDLAGEREALIRLRREAETASRLDHPNLITIFDIGSAPDDAIFIAMELIDGVSLRQWLRDPHSATEIAEVLGQAADGLAAAHASGVVHRDIKPENLMLSRHGFTKVIDFGLAKARLDAPAVDDASTSFLTAEGRIVGTVVYMAPEQLSGEPLDGACDVFALGSVLYEALSGRPPFDAGAHVQTIARILREPPPPLSPEADPRLAALASRMLAKDRASRPTMAEVASELRSIARGTSSSATFSRIAPARRKPWLGVAALLVAVIVTAVWLVTRERPAPEAAPPKAVTAAPVDQQVREIWAKAQFFVGDDKWPVKDRAIPLLEEVVRREPDFLPARTELAFQYGRKAFANDPDRSWEQKAFLEAERVLQLDPRSPVAHSVMAQLKWTKARGFAHEDALIEISKALAADPSYVPALFNRASILMHVGMFDEAMADYENLRKRFPADFDIWVRIARIHLWQGETARALRELREYAPENWQIVIALNELGRREEALAFAEQRLNAGERGDFHSVHALVLASLGRRAEAEKAIAKSISQGQDSSHFHHALYNVACAWSQLGNATKALEALERVSREGMPCYPLFARDPMLDPIRSDPKFVQFLADSKEAFEERRARLAKYAQR